MARGDLHELLHKLTVLYLGVPVFIFLLGWLRPMWGGPLALLLCFVIARHFRDRRAAADSGREPVRAVFIASALVACAAIVAFCGAGGCGVQNSDWLKHNAILRDLVDRPWPVDYPELHGRPPLVYYVAYYLPAAAVGKWLGWTAANLVLLLVTWCGTALAVLWTMAICRAAPWIAVGVFLLFSGMDFIGKTAIALAMGKPFASLAWDQVEWWARYWQYSSNISLLYWVPQHAIAGWLTAAMLLAQRGESATPSATPFVLAMALLWSPFVFLGALPLVAVELFERRWERNPLRTHATALNAAALATGIVLALYLAAHFGQPHAASRTTTASRVNWVAVADASDIRGGFGIAAAHVAFCALEFGCLALAMLMLRPLHERVEKRWLTVALLILGGLPLFRFGYFNDLVMRASIPALFVLLHSLIETAPALGRRRAWTVVLAVVFAAGAMTPIAEITRHVRASITTRTLLVVPDKAAVLSLEQQQARYSFDFLGQYLGSPRSMFFEHLAPRSAVSEPR